MGSDSLLTTSLLQVVNKFIVKICYPQACHKLFQQVVTSLQMTRIEASQILTDLLQLDKIHKSVATC